MRRLIKMIVYFSPLDFLIASASRIGWAVMVKGDDEVDGLIIGKSEFVNKYKEEG